MPKIPQVLADPAGLGRRASASDFGSGQGMAAVGRATSEISDISMHLFEQEMTAKVSGSLADATRALNDLSLGVEAEPDHHKRNKMYADGAGKISKEFREGLRYPKFQGLFDERIEGTLERGRMGIAQNVRQAQVESITANRLRAIEQGAQAAADMDEESGDVYLEENVYPVIAEGTGSSWSALKGEELRQGVDAQIREKRTKDNAMHLVDDLMEQDLTLAEMQQQVFSIPDRELRDEVRQRLKIRHDARETNKVRAASELFRSEYYRVLSGPGTGYKDIETLRDELKAKDFKPETAEYLLGVAAAREAGVTLPTTLATVNDLREKIVNGDIRHASGLFPYLREIGDNFTNLDALITKMNNAEDKEIEDASEDFLKMARARLVKSTLFTFDAAGEQKYFKFQHWFLTERDRRMKLEDTHAGRLTVVREMVNPDNLQAEEGKTYVGGADLDRYKGTAISDAKAASDAMAAGLGKNKPAPVTAQEIAVPVVAQDEAGTRVISVPTPDGNEVQMAIPQRMPGESIGQFEARQVRNALMPSVPGDSQGYGLHVKSFENKDEADRLLGEFLEADYDAKLIPRSVDGKTVYEVHTGPYTVRRAAEAEAEVLAAIYGVEPEITGGLTGTPGAE